MNIENINPGSNLSPDRLQSSQTDDADRVDEASPAQPPSKTESHAPEDRVEISEEGRAQAKNADRAPEEVETARKALLDIPPLSMDRAEDIFKRIQAGYYSQPNSIKKVSESIANEMTGQPPEMGGTESGGSGQTGPELGA